MLDVANNIVPLTDFKRNSSKLLNRMKKSRQPMILTINGKAKVVVQTAEDYQRLVEEVEKMQTIEGIRRGLESLHSKQGRPAKQVFAGLEKKYPYLRRQ